MIIANAHYQDRMSRGVAYKLMCPGEAPKVGRKIDALMFGKSSCGGLSNTSVLQECRFETATFRHSSVYATAFAW